MVNVIELSEKTDEAICLVQKFKNVPETFMINDKFECRIDKKKTVRQLIHCVAQHFGLDVDSFYLIFNSDQTNSSLKTKSLEKLKLVEHDDSLLLKIGLVFGKNTVNRFLLYDIGSLENSDEAACIIHNMEDLKIYPLLVDKNVIVSQFYYKVLQLCKIDDYNTDNLVLIFNNEDKFLKKNLNEDDTRLLYDIGVVYRRGVKNVFEIFLNNQDHKSNEDHSYTSCSPIKNQGIKIQSSKINYLSEGLDLSLITKNYTPSPGPIISKTSSCIQYNNSSERTLEYRGLVNQAMTCYLNCLLQALYMTPEFRNAVYCWKYNFKDIDKEASKSITFQLQQLFLKLQTSSKHCIETFDLTHSFGWSSTESVRQHDLQELCRIMFDALEKELKNTTHCDLINKLYQGKILDYVKCIECGVENTKVLTYLDLTLPIRPFGKTEAYKNLTDALNGYIQPEVLEGNNQYDCENCHKKCDAHKGMKFIQFPYILTVHLMRFDYDYVSMNRIKLVEKVLFPYTLDLNSYTSDNAEPINEIFSEELFGPCNMRDNKNCTVPDTSPSLCDENENKGVNLSQQKNKELGISKTKTVGPYVYDLYAIMLHSGNANGGHYFAYIKDFETNQWLCFNDQSVTKITMKDIEKSYGGKVSREYPESSACAYMLMYRQIDKSKNRYALSPEEFPPHVKNLKNIITLLDEMDEETRVIQQSTFEVPVILIDSMGRNLQSMVFECYENTSLDHLKTWAMKHFKVTKPCQLVIFDKKSKTIDSDVVKDLNNFVIEIVKSKPAYSFLIQLVDSEIQITPGYILMKLFMINVDDTEETIDINYPLEIEMEKNKKIGDLSDFLYLKYNIPSETLLNFVVFIKESSKILLLNRIIECSLTNNNYVFVFIQPNFVNRSTLLQKIRSIITRFHYTIRLQFVLSSNDTDFYLAPEDNYLATYSMYLDASGENVKQSEDNYLADRSMKEDIETRTFNSEHEPKKIDDLNILEDNGFIVIGDIRDNTTFTFNEKYSFKIITLPSENNERCDAYVDKRMNVKELRKYLEPHINLPMDFVSVRIYKPDNTSELASPQRTLIDLNDFDTIQISFDLLADQYCVSVLYHLGNNKRNPVTKLFDWVITAGTSVLDTKKQLLIKLKEEHNIDIPLERFRLRKIRGNVLMKCYLNEDIWDKNIGQEWHMIIYDLIDRSEHELDKTKQLVIVALVGDNNDAQTFVKSELEFVVDNASITSVNIQLAKMISIKLNISEDELELGFTEDFKYFSWRTKKTNWLFDLFDVNICITCRCKPKEYPF